MTNANSPRPTQSVQEVLLDSMDDMVARLTGRLAGMTDTEYQWEPVAGMWSVRATTAGAAEGVVDFNPDSDIDPAPMTTIAWRLWHLSIDCFADYADRLAGTPKDEVDPSWTMSADEAVRRVEASWLRFRGELTSFDDWFQELGSGFGPWHRHCIADFAMHASNELVHHGAEIALLRDLYRAQDT